VLPAVEPTESSVQAALQLVAAGAAAGVIAEKANEKKKNSIRIVSLSYGWVVHGKSHRSSLAQISSSAFPSSSSSLRPQSARPSPRRLLER
jgi:hypothetical protein